MDFKQRQFRCKIKGDAGVYEVWAIDWYNQSVLVYRACGYEWLPFDKIQSLMQYTGLKDKNGKEIYEGDVVARYGTPYVVAWYDNLAKWYLKGIHTGNTGITKSDMLLACEVIGNIHEHPDLCK